MISQKGLYGTISGVFTTSVLQPFETVKMAIMVPPKDLTLTTNFSKNMKSAIEYILKNNGIKGLYKGLFAAATKSAIGCYIYFSILRYFQHKNQTHFEDFILSSIARVMSTFFTNALGIIQTRWQLANFHGYKSITGAVLEIFRKQGIQGYFSGALTSCLKEGLFGGFYYMIYQELKGLGLSKFSAGLISGFISTGITHPFELARARIQTMGIGKQYSYKDRHLLKQVKFLIESGNWFQGVVPRLIKKPVANTLTFVIFEVIEELQNKKSSKM